MFGNAVSYVEPSHTVSSTNVPVFGRSVRAAVSSMYGLKEMDRDTMSNFDGMGEFSIRVYGMCA